MRYINSDKAIWFNLKAKARLNRMNQTFAEELVWNLVRDKRLGHRFRRQHVIYHFIVDFACLEKMLILEIDGDSHLGKQDYDEERTKVLNELGFTVIRFTNDEVETNGNMVEKRILEYLNE